MDKQRLRRIRNYQSTDWYPAVFLRPLTILIMLVIADWKFLTPNRLTHLGNLSKIAATVMILMRDWPATIAAVILLHLGALFDHLDGTMARYRHAFSSTGAFYDKVSDAVTWFPIIMAAGWVAYQEAHDERMLILAATHCYGFLVIGYLKWVAHAESQRRDWFRVASGDSEPIGRNTAPPSLSEPPDRSARDWLIWFARSTAQIIWVGEMDLFFWLSLGLLFDQLPAVLWVFAVSYGLGVPVMAFKRGSDVRAVDRELERLRAPKS